MAMTTADLRNAFNRHRAQSEVAGVALLALVVALLVGGAAKRARQPLDQERARLASSEQEIASFRSAFQPATLEESAVRLPDSLAIGVVREDRFTLAQQVAQRAEQIGLRGVRVRFAPPEAGVAAPPIAAGGKVTVADYAVVLDLTGSYANVLTLVKRLPPSVALQSISATHGDKGTPAYHVVLTVFEAPAGAGQHG